MTENSIKVTSKTQKIGSTSYKISKKFDKKLTLLI